jgi:hypothetical protein
MKLTVPSGKQIGFMALQGFGMFFTITGMAGISLILGPLNMIVKFDFTTMFGNPVLDFLFCILLCVIGGAISFISDIFIKELSR